jgi:hypothetical protein
MWEDAVCCLQREWIFVHERVLGAGCRKERIKKVLELLMSLFEEHMASRLEVFVQLLRPEPSARIDVEDVATFVLV